MKINSILLLIFISLTSHALMTSEVVFVESPTDTDSDGVPDKIYVSISRPVTDKKLSSLYDISPYSTGGNYDAKNHDVDVDLLPQSEPTFKAVLNTFKEELKRNFDITEDEAHRYAKVSAHSIGTGRSTGCPTVGDINETLAAKAVIDWLNGRAKAFYENGQEAIADWANGNVGMTGVSYNGTLPTMVAATGVEGLKAIVPVAAISNWYDYYRANGLVVNPGGFIGEDADVLGYFIVRRGTCKSQLERITETMGRENGDYTPFWQARNHLANAKKIKAATFIIHGQSDWNVKGKNAIQLWEALEGVAPRRMYLHRGGHGLPSGHNTAKRIQEWFDHFLEGEENGITDGPQIIVDDFDGSYLIQEKWPHESTQKERFYFSATGKLVNVPEAKVEQSFKDLGKTKKLESFMASPDQQLEGRLLYMSPVLTADRLLSGTPKITLQLSVKNRNAANLTVAIIEINKYGKREIITRGWADPQNHNNMTRGELLGPNTQYTVSFDLEPKQHQFEKGSRFGILVSATDFEYTLRPTAGTELEVTLGNKSFAELMISRE